MRSDYKSESRISDFKLPTGHQLKAGFYFQVLCVNFCSRVEGSSLKILLQRCRNLKCLLMQQTNLKDEYVMAAEWDKATALQVSQTDLQCGSKIQKCSDFG